MQSDKDLVQAVVDGHRSAFAVLIERYERPVRSLATAILRDTHLAEDVAQEAFTKAYEKLSMLRDGSAFGHWILKVTRRCAYQIARKRLPSRTLDTAQETTRASHNGQLNENLDRLLQAVVCLPEHERIVVMLRYFDDHSVDTIATMTGRSVGTVTKQLTRARSRLKTWLKKAKQ